MDANYTRLLRVTESVYVLLPDPESPHSPAQSSSAGGTVSKMSKKYSQHFRDFWLKDEKFKDWLRKVEGDDTKAMCKYCKCSLGAKLSDLEKHRNTVKHKRAAEPFSCDRQRVLPFEKISDDSRRCEGRLSLFVAEHCALRTVDHLSEVCKSCFSDSKGCKDLKMKRSKCSAIVCNLLAPHFVQDLRTDIGDSKFSLLIDESNDISITKLLGIVIRYYSASKKAIIVTYLDMIELNECDSETICNALKRSLENNGLELNNLIALGTDNASVMTGVNNGVYAKLKKDVPHLILIRCVCHSLQLAVSHATSVHLPKSLEFLIRETYNWFSHSAVRQTKYKAIYGLINDGMVPLKLVQLSQTRWMSIERAVERILQQWVELKLHFELCKHQEKCYTAEQLYLMFCDKKNYVFLIFLKSVLGEVQRVNKSFEAAVHDPTKLLNDLVHLINSLRSRIVVPGRNIDVYDGVEKYLDPKPHLGYEFEKELSECKFSDEKDIRQRCIWFLVELIKQLQQRLPENVRALQSMSSLSADVCLQPIKSDIIDLAKMFYDDAATVTRINFQWKKLHHIKWTETTSTLHLWAEIASYRDATGDNPFEDLSRLALTLLCLPHSNADVERIFSHMNIVKTKLRNRLSIKSLNAIMAIKYGLRRHGKCCHNYDLPIDVIRKIGTMTVYQVPSLPSAAASGNLHVAEAQASCSFGEEASMDWDFLTEFE